jgi:hypothetical protein
MQAKPTLVLPFRPDFTQTLRFRMMGVVQKCGVLNGQHHFMAFHPLHGVLAMWQQNLGWPNFFVVHETIGRFAVCPIFTRLG